jgi:hypothetical protein
MRSNGDDEILVETGATVEQVEDDEVKANEPDKSKYLANRLFFDTIIFCVAVVFVVVVTTLAVLLHNSSSSDTTTNTEQQSEATPLPGPTTTGPPVTWSTNFPLPLCGGDCDADGDCQDGLICFQRGANVPVPGCSGGSENESLTDYCVKDPSQFTSAPVTPVPSPPTPSPSKTLSEPVDPSCQVVYPSIPNFSCVSREESFDRDGRDAIYYQFSVDCDAYGDYQAQTGLWESGRTRGTLFSDDWVMLQTDSVIADYDGYNYQSNPMDYVDWRYQSNHNECWLSFVMETGYMSEIGVRSCVRLRLHDDLCSGFYRSDCIDLATCSWD